MSDADRQRIELDARRQELKSTITSIEALDDLYRSTIYRKAFKAVLANLKARLVELM